MNVPSTTRIRARNCWPGNKVHNNLQNDHAVPLHRKRWTCRSRHQPCIDNVDDRSWFTTCCSLERNRVISVQLQLSLTHLKGGYFIHGRFPCFDHTYHCRSARTAPTC